MMMRSAVIALSMLFLAGAAYSGQADSSEGPRSDADKKIIVFGYNTQMPGDVVKNMDVYEASPFQGMVMGAKVRPQSAITRGGRKYDRLAWLTWGAKLTEADIAETTRILASRHKSDKVTEFFIRLNIAPGGVDWFDDRAWAERVSNNWRLVGKLVRLGRLRGIAFDTEQYRQCADVFSFRFASGGGKHTWPECTAKAFQRGQEAARALNSEIAHLDVLTMFAHAYAQRRMHASGATSLRQTPYSLMPAFFDGFMSAKAPKTRLYDGWEGAYRYKKRDQFRQAHDSIRRRGAEISLVPETYMANMHASFGIWICDAKGRWNPARPYYKPKELEAAIRYAYEFTDRYVWIYQERIHPWKAPLFSDGYWKAIRNAAAPYKNVKASRPLAARPMAPPPAKAVPAREPARLVAHWPLRTSLDNPLGADALQPAEDKLLFTRLAAKGDSGLLLDGVRGYASIPADRLPGRIERHASIRAAICPTGSDVGRAYPIVSGALGRGAVFELATRGNGEMLRFEFTRFDRTGRPIGWQATDYDYPSYAAYSVVAQFRNGRFDGVFVNRHQAIFGLWDLKRHPKKEVADTPRADTSRLYIGRSAGGAGETLRRFAGLIGDVQVYTSPLARSERRALVDRVPHWQILASPGLVLLDMTEADESRGLLTDKWRIPSGTTFALKTAGAAKPQFVDHAGRRAMRFSTRDRGYLEALSMGRESQPLHGFRYTISFQLASMPPAGEAYGLFGRGDGSSGNTSFGIYVDAGGRVHAHVRTSTNFAKSFSAAAGRARARKGAGHVLSFSLDKPNGVMTLVLDGREIGRGPIHHSESLVQTIRHRPLPLRIGYVRVGPDEYTTFQPKARHCFLDGTIHEFRIERTTK